MRLDNDRDVIECSLCGHLHFAPDSSPMAEDGGYLPCPVQGCTCDMDDTKGGNA